MKQCRYQYYEYGTGTWFRSKSSTVPVLYKLSLKVGKDTSTGTKLSISTFIEVIFCSTEKVSQHSNRKNTGDKRKSCALVKKNLILRSQ